MNFDFDDSDIYVYTLTGYDTLHGTWHSME